MSHEAQVKALGSIPIDQLVQDYKYEASTDTAFKTYLASQQDLWQAKNVKAFETAGNPPTKDVVLGAWRDLDRCEALLELIDNSIDAWSGRRAMYPVRTPKNLDIYIDVDSATGKLTYEDNAGGVPLEKLDHLVVPGYSNTTPLSPTIGSYKTGGKKAIFRLAVEASITTRYLDPAGATDDAVSIHLDRTWMEDPAKYEFTYATLKDQSVIEKGQTRYVLSLRREPNDAPWFKSPDDLGKIIREVRRIYTLLLLRRPEIHIFVNDRSRALMPEDHLYDFCGTEELNVDIRPQALTFMVELDYEGKAYDVEIEMVLGCRTTTGVRDGHTWGIDLYGNDRLFVAYDQETFEHWLPKGQTRAMIRGFVNIRGANVFVPWDTHKRHLNTDREVMRILTKHRDIKEFFENWARVYKDISGAGKGEVTRLISKPLEPRVAIGNKDLNIPHRDTVSISAKSSRASSLPSTVFKPSVKLRVPTKNEAVIVKITFSREEARKVSAWLELTGEPVASELGIAIKEDVLARVVRRPGRPAKRQV